MKSILYWSGKDPVMNLFPNAAVHGKKLPEWNLILINWTRSGWGWFMARRDPAAKARTAPVLAFEAGSRLALNHPTNIARQKICHGNSNRVAFRLWERRCRDENSSSPTRPRRRLRTLSVKSLKKKHYEQLVITKCRNWIPKTTKIYHHMTFGTVV